MVLIFPLQIKFDISVWFQFGITFILLSPFAQDMQIWAFFDLILAIMTSEIMMPKFVKPVLTSQYIFLKVSIDSYFDCFITICMRYTN